MEKNGNKSEIEYRQTNELLDFGGAFGDCLVHDLFHLGGDDTDALGTYQVARNLK